MFYAGQKSLPISSLIRPIDRVSFKFEEKSENRAVFSSLRHWIIFSHLALGDIKFQSQQTYLLSSFYFEISIAVSSVPAIFDRKRFDFDLLTRNARIRAPLGMETFHWSMNFAAVRVHETNHFANLTEKKKNNNKKQKKKKKLVDSKAHHLIWISLFFIFLLDGWIFTHNEII